MSRTWYIPEREPAPQPSRRPGESAASPEPAETRLELWMS